MSVIKDYNVCQKTLFKLLDRRARKLVDTVNITGVLSALFRLASGWVDYPASIDGLKFENMSTYFKKQQRNYAVKARAVVFLVTGDILEDEHIGWNDILNEAETLHYDEYSDLRDKLRVADQKRPKIKVTRTEPTHEQVLHALQEVLDKQAQDGQQVQDGQ